MAPKIVSVWSSGLTNSACLSHNNWAVQVWGSSSWQENYDLISNGYSIVMSHVNAWYLDCGFGSWRTTGTTSIHSHYKYINVQHKPSNRLNISLYIRPFHSTIYKYNRKRCLRPIHNMAQGVQTSALGTNASGAISNEAGK